jgi:hypothetical protein
MNEASLTGDLARRWDQDKGDKHRRSQPLSDAEVGQIGFHPTRRGWVPRTADVNARMVVAVERRRRRLPDDEPSRVIEDIRRLLIWEVVDLHGLGRITDPDRVEVVRIGRAVNRVLLSGIERAAKEQLLARLEYAARQACTEEVAETIARRIAAALAG